MVNFEKFESLKNLIMEAKIIDLTHKIDKNIPIMPFQKPPSIETILDYNQGALVRRLSIDEHEGTHVDAPAHFVSGGITIDKIDIRKFFSHAYVVDVRKNVQNDSDYKLSIQDIKDFEKKNNLVINGGIVLMWTGWDLRWTDTKTYFGIDDAGAVHFPGFSKDLVELLVEERKIVGIGVDGPSVDCGTDHTYSVHNYVLSKGLFEIENLTRLEEIGAPLTQLIVAPMNLSNGSGAPARVYGIVFD